MSDGQDEKNGDEVSWSQAFVAKPLRWGSSALLYCHDPFEAMRSATPIATWRLFTELALLFALALFLGCLHHALRADRPLFVPPHNPAASDLPMVTAREVRDSLGSPEVVLVDARPGEAFSRETLPGSVSLPLHANWDETLIDRLRKVGFVVVFCSDAHCYTSREVALALRARGLTGVKVFPGGVKEWKGLGFPMAPGL